MSAGLPAPASQPPNNPLSINIEFNINHPHAAPQLNQLIRGKKLDSEVLNLKNNLCGFQVKTPELPQTDREAYSKDMEYLRPMDDRRKKHKRNSMDINAPLRSLNETSDLRARLPKGNTTVLRKTDLSFKQDFQRKKKVQRNEMDTYRKGEMRSTAIEGRSEKKGAFHKSLKNIIHKIVNNQLSKRSLTGIPSSKISKSPYCQPSPQPNSTARKRNTKKKSMSCKSEKGLSHPQNEDEIVQKLNSLKSMTNSILRSQVEQVELPYYSKQRGKIRIDTDHSIDFLEEISFYQKKTKRQDQRKETINRAAVEETARLIDSYIQLMNEQEEERDHPNYYQEDEIPVRMEESDTVPYTFQNSRNIRDAISNQMRNLFQQQQLTEEISAEREIQEAGTAKAEKVELSKGEGGQSANAGQTELRAFMSSQMERPVTVSSQLERLKLQELKRQEIEKWGYLLEFIKKNMHSDQADTQTVLNQVYWFLQRSKNDLQQDLSAQQRPSPVDDDFTVKYSQQRQPHQNSQYYQGEQPSQEPEQRDTEEVPEEEVGSFKEDYTEENEDLKLLSLDTISTALKHRQMALDKQREKEIAILEERKENGKLNEAQYDRELERIQKWTKRELAEIKRAKKNIWKGYHQAKGVLDKTVNSRYFQEHEHTAKKMMKCLSETYLKKQKVDYKQLLKPQNAHSHSSHSSSHPSLLANQEIEEEHHEQQLNRPLQQLQQKSRPLLVPPKILPVSKQEEEQQYEQSFQNSQSSAEAQFQQSGQLTKEDKGQLSDVGEHQHEVQDSNRSQQMEEIKQRLLRMKREHYGLEDGDGHQLQDGEGHINYEQIQKSLQQEYSDEQMAIVNKEVGQSFLPNKSELEKYRQLQNKLKYCCSEDKEDIFQFIFLDLCIELYQQPCKDNKIMKAINSHVARVKNQAKKKKGVKTNLNVVKEYLKRFTAFLLRTNRNCLNNLDLPMGPTALQMLRYMHDADYDIPEQEEEVPTLIIPITVFDKFQQSLLPTLQFQEYYDDPDKQEARINFLKTILHIHNKALFDSLNEFMDHQRPFGIWGKPFPWKNSSSFTHHFSEALKEDKLKKGAQKVVEQCSYVCGLLVDKEESLVGNAKISEAYVEQIRQDRLSRMLANQLVQSEERWLFYDDEETEVLVQIASYVWNLILFEVKTEIAALHLPS